MTTLDPRALDALKNNQRQLDMDGCEVGVSRQALDELLAAYAALSQPQAGEVVAWLIQSNCGGNTWAQLTPDIAEADRDYVDIIPLYASPQPANPAQEAREEWYAKAVERVGRRLNAIDAAQPTNPDDCRETAEFVIEDIRTLTAAIGAGGQEARPQHVAYFDDGQFHWMSGIAPRNCELYTHPSQPAERVVEAHLCATEGCDKPASVHFVRGGIGSYYCHNCYMRVQALAQEGRNG